MRIHTINTGSFGNGYIIEANGEYLVIECGVKAREMLSVIGFDVGKVSGCICSHLHGDHAKYIGEYTRYGFPVCMSEESRGDTSVTAIPRMKSTKLGNYVVIPFRVPHNGIECDGFCIRNAAFGTLLFMTDAEMCPYDMSGFGVNHLMIECNYSLDYVNVESPNVDHVLKGHMELETCKRFIRSIYGNGLKSIGLIHLSTGNADPVRFETEIRNEFPACLVWIAKKGLTVEL